MHTKTWLRLGDQTAGNFRASTQTYMLALAALTATIVFSPQGEYQFLLIVMSIGLGIFGLLSFENAQQGFISLMKAMPEDVANTEAGEALRRTPFALFRAANAVLVTLIVIAQIVSIAQ